MADPRRFSAGRPPQRRPSAPQSGAPRVRKHTVRLSADVVAHVRSGHPFVFREAVGRALHEESGALLELVDDDGQFVARGLYDPEGVVAVRVVSRDPNHLFGKELLASRFRAAKALRERLVAAPDLTAYRLVNAEGDGVPAFTLDRYDDFLVAQLFSAALEPHLDALYDAAMEVFAPKGIYEQRRYRPQTGDGPRAPATLVRGAVAPVEIIVKENGLSFLTDVTAPLSTGLFPDLRRGRETVGRLAAGRKMLNLFSYTGAFSVYAARGGAASTTSVDLAQKAQARARRNFELNQLDLAKVELVSGDAFALLAQFAERQRTFDLIVLDPPSFSQAKSAGKTKTFQALRDYGELVSAALSVAAPGAILACAANTHKLSVEDHDRAIGEGAFHARRTVRTLERIGLPPDFAVPAGFAEGHYLKLNLIYAE